ncbi:MAG: hypothetical protein JXR96_18670 [Deltaproteobacteria bacterium]|nr:hypothetical protein [Deltaproteobacteria bacterium]
MLRQASMTRTLVATMLVLACCVYPLEVLAQAIDLECQLYQNPDDPRFTINGGRFLDGQGWRVGEQGTANIRVSLEHGINEGFAEINVKNYQPQNAIAHTSGNEHYTPIFSMFEQPNIGHGIGMTTEAFEVMARTSPQDPASNDYKRTKLAIWGPCMVPALYIGDHGQEKRFNWNPDHTYHIRVDWTPARITLHIEDIGAGSEGSGAIELSWTCQVAPNFRYLYIAHNPGNYDKIPFAIYSDLVIRETDECAAHCRNERRDCGEEGIDCGGECQACGLDGGVDAGDGGDTGDGEDGFDGQDHCLHHCANKRQDCGEEGVDCGGGCEPCESEEEPSPGDGDGGQPTDDQDSGPMDDAAQCTSDSDCGDSSHCVDGVCQPADVGGCGCGGIRRGGEARSLLLLALGAFFVRRRSSGGASRGSRPPADRS